MMITDSIIQAENATGDAIIINTGKLSIKRTTVFGKMSAHRLYASDIIFTGLATVTDTQTGCFRFSAAPKDSRLPRPYESFLFEKDSEHWFYSKAIRALWLCTTNRYYSNRNIQGGENGAEMGAFNSLLNAIKDDGLKLK